MWHAHDIFYFAKTTQIASQIDFPYGRSIPIGCFRQIQFENRLSLTEALCVPSFKCNCLSVFKMAKDNHYFFIILFLCECLCYTGLCCPSSKGDW